MGPIVGAPIPQTILADGSHKEMFIGRDYDGSKIPNMLGIMSFICSVWVPYVFTFTHQFSLLNAIWYTHKKKHYFKTSPMLAHCVLTYQMCSYQTLIVACNIYKVLCKSWSYINEKKINLFPCMSYHHSHIWPHFHYSLQ